MKNTITAILAAALTFTLLTSCGSVDKTADVTVTTTESAWQPALITAASVTTAERQTSSTFTEKSTTTTKAVTTTKKTTTKKTTTSKATTTTKATTTAPITTTTAAPRTTTTAAATTTKKATTTTKVTTAKPKPTTTTAVAAKLTQKDINRLVNEMQEYSNEKARPWVEQRVANSPVYKGSEQSVIDRVVDEYLADCSKTPSNSSWDNPGKYYEDTWTYEEAFERLKNSVDSAYERFSDSHIVVYAKRCIDDSGENVGDVFYEIYMLR